MKVGDEVLILALHPPGLNMSEFFIPKGTVGVVKSIRHSFVSVTVEYQIKGRPYIYGFYLNEIELVDGNIPMDGNYHPPMVEPEMELDEIERAEELLK